MIFTSLAIIGTTQNKSANDITASSTGLMIVAFVAMAFCAVGAVVLGFYNEKKIMKIIAKPADGEAVPAEPVLAATDEEVADEDAPIEAEKAEDVVSDEPDAAADEEK